MQTTQLRDLRLNGCMQCEVNAVVPPHVEYSMTKKSRACLPVIETIRNYGLALIKVEEIEH